MREPLEKILKDELKLQSPLLQIEKLFGHASSRTYYRIFLSDGQTYILMQMPEGASSISEEITRASSAPQELPFLNIQRYLAELRLPVPEVYGWFPDQRFMILKDLGDDLLEVFLKQGDEEAKIREYQKAIDLLVAIQKKTSQAPSSNCVAYARQFDEHLLNWEFDHFLEFGIEDRFQIELSPSAKKEFENWTRRITQEILKFPQGWTHRDFQSRNLIVKNKQLFLLDFQDALIGPIVYDLVSLLRDSYIPLSWDSVKKLMEYYLFQREDSKIPWESPQEFSRYFDLVTLQRKLKDAGRFQYIHTVKKNSNFLPYVAPSLGYVKEALGHLEEFAPLSHWLKQYLPEI